MNQTDCTPEMKTDTAYLPDDLNWRVLKPAQAARAVARVNGHLSPAKIIVRAWSPKGRSGRKGWAHKHTTFVAVDGQVNLLKTRRSKGKLTRNGCCQMCGSVYADYALVWAEAPDGWLEACPACISTNHLRTSEHINPLLFVAQDRNPVRSKMAKDPMYAYRIFVDLTVHSATVEACEWGEFVTIERRTHAAIEMLKKWIEAKSDMPSLDAFFIISECLHEDMNPESVLRKDMALVEFLVEKLPDCDNVHTLRALAREVRGKK